MNISSPSFGKKIPIATCKVQDKKTRQFEPVTIYKVDCADSSDIREINDLQGSWRFKKRIVEDMNSKHQLQKYGEDDGYNAFYVIQSEDNTILGMSETEEIDDGIHNINYIETKSPKRFVGQVLIATIGQDVINQYGKALTVTEPEGDAYEFYTDVCGFSEIDDDYLRMTSRQIDRFIEQTEDRTNSMLFDIRG